MDFMTDPNVVLGALIFPIVAVFASFLIPHPTHSSSRKEKWLLMLVAPAAIMITAGAAALLVHFATTKPMWENTIVDFGTIGLMAIAPIVLVLITREFIPNERALVFYASIAAIPFPVASFYALELGMPYAFSCIGGPFYMAWAASIALFVFANWTFLHFSSLEWVLENTFGRVGRRLAARGRF